MKRKLSEDRIREENKRKRQLSIVKKKKSKSRKQMKLKNVIDKNVEKSTSKSQLTYEKKLHNLGIKNHSQ